MIYEVFYTLVVFMKKWVSILNIILISKGEGRGRLTLGSSPYGSAAPKPYRWALCDP